MGEARVTVRLSSGDLNRLLGEASDIDLRYRDGRFELSHTVAKVTLTANFYPEVSGGRLRFVVPFGELRSDRGTGPLVRGALSMAWNWIETKLESVLAEKLSARGLPWDLVWVDGQRDQTGKSATVNVSLAVLNQWLADKSSAAGLPTRLAGMRVEPEALELHLSLTPASAHVTW
ncbi:MAG: hypothetical protein HZB16_05250 [Armatimonadetes bacterium]|nr:hypothetical protein [Armatimonadota bacterium]